jgi:hypothetical protein
METHDRQCLLTGHMMMMIQLLAKPRLYVGY